jgi:NADH-quinone oxidoreductase subunit H
METLFYLIVAFIKAAIVMGALLQAAALVTWVERKGSALIQNRVGANRASIVFGDLAGIWNTLVADPVKALTKEDFLPRGTSQFMHSLAPFMGVFPVLLSFAVVPFGPPIEIDSLVIPWFFGPELVLENVSISLQLAELDVGILYVLAMGSLAVYGTVLAGWVSNNKFSLFGSLRASAQMISYEITMGISIIGLLAMYQTLDFAEIVRLQSGTVLGILPNWGIFMSPFNFVAFLIFFTSAMAETKRAPFDLPESESELVAGYFTEYSGMKFLLFWLGEFAEIVVASTLVVVLFFGGWQLPYYDLSQLTLGPLLGTMVFGAKVAAFSVLQVIIRWTVPRFRYDQLLALCWKIMLPIAIVNLVLSIVWMLLFP